MNKQQVRLEVLKLTAAAGNNFGVPEWIGRAKLLEAYVCEDQPASVAPADADEMLGQPTTAVLAAGRRSGKTGAK